MNAYNPVPVAAVACILGFLASLAAAGTPPPTVQAGAAAPVQPTDPISIACQLIDMPPDVATRFFAAAGAKSAVEITPEQQKQLLATDGVDVLSAPRITALPGQPAEIKVVQERSFTTGFKSDAESGGWEPVVEKKEIGITLTVTATPYPGDPERLHGTLELSVSRLLGIMEQKVNPPGQAAPLAIASPTIAVRSLNTTFDLHSGATVLLAGMEGQVNTGASSERRVLAVLLTADNTARATALFRKTSILIIPKIEFEEATLEQIVAFLRKRSKELDPDAEGVNLVLTTEPGRTAAGDQDARDPGDATLTLSLNNIPLSEVLRYVAAATGLAVRYDANAIVLSPK